MDRLTVEDQLMLWPDQLWPQDIGALAVLDGGPLLGPGGEVRIDVARAAVAARLHLVPRFRRVLHHPRRGLGRPLWVDDAAFDLAHHVRVAQVAAPGDEAALLQTVEGLRRRRLDMSRPLWEMWFLAGLPDGRLGLFVRLHHVVADGIAGVATMAAFLDAGPDASTPQAPPWTPAAPPPPFALLVDNLRDRGDRLRRTLAALLRPATTVRRVRAAWPSLRELAVEDRVPPTTLNRVIGADRTLAVARGRLDPVAAVAHAHGATVNDVLLTLTAAGLRGLIGGRGEPVEGLVVRVFVPVTLRAADERAGARGNLIGQMVVPLPVGTADPSARLEAIAAETARRKARRRPSLGSMVRGRLTGALLLQVVRRNPTNVETADVPGPPQSLYLAGARVLEVFPLLNLTGNVTLGVGALSYAGQFDVMAVADRDAVPDLDVFMAGVRDELDALATTLSVPSASG